MSVFDSIMPNPAAFQAPAVPVPADRDIRKEYMDDLRRRALEMTSSGDIDLDEADIRFSTAVNLSRVRDALVVLVGCGGLGNRIWRELLAMGFRRLAVFDDDTVGIENVGSQCHSIFDIGRPKVDAVADEAMRYRGISVMKFGRRVMTIDDIVAAVGSMPDIVIGATDSAEFRNSLINSLDVRLARHPEGSTGELPDLFLDYRMSLGDWVCYAVPLRDIVRRWNVDGRYNMRSWGTSWFRGTYMPEAEFRPEEAVQEPCTERAIAFTGANVASHAGAFLRWWFSPEGRAVRTDVQSFKDFLGNGVGGFCWRTSFSARDWEFISQPASVTRLRERCAERVSRAEGSLEAVLRGLCGIPNLTVSEWGHRAVRDLVGKFVMFINGTSSPGLHAVMADRDHGPVRAIPVCGYNRTLMFAFNGVEPPQCLTLSRSTDVIAAVVDGDTLRSTALGTMIRHPAGTVFESAIDDMTNYRIVIRDNVPHFEILDGEGRGRRVVTWGPYGGNGDNVGAVLVENAEKARLATELFDSLTGGGEAPAETPPQERARSPFLPVRIERSEIAAGDVVAENEDADAAEVAHVTESTPGGSITAHDALGDLFSLSRSRNAWWRFPPRVPMVGDLVSLGIGYDVDYVVVGTEWPGDGHEASVTLAYLRSGTYDTEVVTQRLSSIGEIVRLGTTVTEVPVSELSFGSWIFVDGIVRRMTSRTLDGSPRPNATAVLSPTPETAGLELDPDATVIRYDL